MATRWVVVDDTSRDINYIGDSWFADVGSQDSAGNFGPPYLSTLHGTNTSASLTFNFTGSAVRVMGANHIRNDSGVIDPQWSCYVDGVGIDSNSPGPFQYPENNWRFCYSSSLSDAPHTITVNATVAKSQTFWLDRIEYAPSASVPLSNKSIIFTSPDPAMQFGMGWNSYANIGNWTQTQGGMFALNFYGTSLSWYGHIPTEWSGNSTTGTWAIDNNPAQVFLLKGHGANANTVYNQKFFETSVYPLGSHTLTVTYNGDSSKTPLVLAYLVIQNNTAATSSAGSTSATTPSTPSHLPAIIGGIVGGIACLLVVVLLVLYRRRRRSNQEMRIVVDEPSDYAPEPVNFSSFPSQLPPSKSMEGLSSRVNFLSPGASPTNSSETGRLPLDSAASGDGQHSRNPSTSQISDSTPVAAGRPKFVVHQDSGTRLPQVTHGPLVDIPPAYTPD